MGKWLALTLTLGVLFFCEAAAASADATTVCYNTGCVTLGAAYYQSSVYDPSGNIMGYSPGTYNYTNSLGINAEITMSGSDNSVSVSQTGPASSVGTTSQGEINYFFAIVGPAATNIPILIRASLQANGSGDYQSYAEVDSLQNALLCYGFGCNSYPPGTVQGTAYSASFADNALADEAYSLDIVAGNSIGPMGGSAFSSVDPFIEIDPSFPDAGQYIVALVTVSRMEAFRLPSPALLRCSLRR